MIYHGTTKSNLDKILLYGFEDRMIMFADNQIEANRYAESYSRINNDRPVLISIDEKRLNINYNSLDYEAARKLYEEGQIDGYLSDRNSLSNYYVVFNTHKLKDLICL